MKDDDYKLLRGFDYGQTDRRTDFCDCRVAFATENCPEGDIGTFSINPPSPKLEWDKRNWDIKIS